MTGPMRHVVRHPSAHRRAVAIGARHADLRSFFRIDVTARRAKIQTIAQARIGFGALFVERESWRPARILIDPWILDAVRRGPAERAPDVENEGAIFGC